MRKLLFWLRMRWCERTGGHAVEEARTHRTADGWSIHRWCAHCGVHGEIKCWVIRS